MWSVVTLGRGGWRNGIQLSCPVLPFHPCAPGGFWLPLAPQSPRQAYLNIALSPCSSVARGPRAWPHLKPRLQLWLLVFEAAVVASSKRGWVSAADETRGAIYSGVALGPGAGPRAWGGSATPHQGPVKSRWMECWVSCVPLGG